MEQSGQFIASYLQKLKQTTSTLSKEETIRKFAQNQESSETAVQSLMKTIIETDPDLVSAVLVTKDGRVVKGVNFTGLRDAGDPVELAKRYDAQGADEITFLDVSASAEGRGTMLDVVSAPAEPGGAPDPLDDHKQEATKKPKPFSELEKLRAAVESIMGPDGLDYTAGERAEFFFQHGGDTELSHIKPNGLAKILSEARKALQKKDAEAAAHVPDAPHDDGMDLFK